MMTVMFLLCDRSSKQGARRLIVPSWCCPVWSVECVSRVFGLSFWESAISSGHWSLWQYC